MRSEQAGAQATPTPIEQPILQAQVDRIGGLARDLDKTLSCVAEAVDRLANRPPHPVDELAHGSAGTQTRPSIEGALNMHVAYLEGLCRDANVILGRLNRAV